MHKGRDWGDEERRKKLREVEKKESKDWDQEERPGWKFMALLPLNASYYPVWYNLKADLKA